MSTHRCPTCRRQKHDFPKAWRIPRSIIFAVLFTAVEITAALHLDGLLSVALWVIAAYNITLALLLLGISVMAATAEGARDA